MSDRLDTQKKKVLDYLEFRKVTNVREMFNVLGINSPTKVMSDLIASGAPITATRVNVYDEDGKVRNHFTEYRLEAN